MDIFRERELLAKQEEDFRDNFRFQDLPIYKQRYVIKNEIMGVGDTVWLNKVGPRIITSVRMMNDEEHPRYVTLAEEYGRFDIEEICKYKVREHLDWVEFVKKIDWKFLYKYGLPLCLIPVELTIATFCLLLNGEALVFHEFNFEFGLLVVASTILASSLIYAIVGHIVKFTRKLQRNYWRNRKTAELNLEYEALGLNRPVPQEIRNNAPIHNHNRVAWQPPERRVRGADGEQVAQNNGRRVGAPVAEQAGGVEVRAVQFIEEDDDNDFDEDFDE